LLGEVLIMPSPHFAASFAACSAAAATISSGGSSGTS
jgi:hypothetical protein